MESKQWCIALFCGTILLYASRVALPMSISIVASQYDWSKTDSGIVLSCFFWGYVCTQAGAGYLADVYGGEHILLVATLIWSILTLFTPYFFTVVHNTPFPLALIIIFRVALGVSQGFHFPTIASLISRNLPPVEKARLFGLVMAGSHAGTVVCGSIGSVVLEYFGWEPLFYIIGILGIIWWLHFSYVCKTTAERRIALGHLDTEQKSPKSLIFANGIDIESSYSASSPNKRAPGALHSNTPLPWAKLFTKIPFWAACCAHFCGANAYFTLFSWLPSYFSENFPEAKGWVFNFVPNLAVMITALIAPTIASKMIEKGASATVVRKIMEGSSQLGLAVCLICVSSVSSYEAALLFLSAAMGLRGLHHGGVCVNPQDFAPNHTGAVFGLMNMASALPGFIGVYAAGYILDVYHSWNYVFSWTALVCLVGVTVYTAFGTGKQII